VIQKQGLPLLSVAVSSCKSLSALLFLLKVLGLPRIVFENVQLHMGYAIFLLMT
jgi:hypothetical protein